MKSILGIGNALTDILAVLPDDSLLREFHLPKGSMQHVDSETGDKIWAALRPLGVKYVAGGSAANTITCTSILGMPSSFMAVSISRCTSASVSYISARALLCCRAFSRVISRAMGTSLTT